MSFSCNDFLMEGLRDAVGKVPNYQIVIDATNLYKNKMLTLNNLVEIHNLIYLEKYIHEDMEAIGDPSSYIVTY